VRRRIRLEEGARKVAPIDEGEVMLGIRWLLVGLVEDALGKTFAWPRPGDGFRERQRPESAR
jgi:hypothetical protein